MIVQPTDQMSDAVVKPDIWMISGAIQYGVPTTELACHVDARRRCGGVDGGVTVWTNRREVRPRACRACRARRARRARRVRRARRARRVRHVRRVRVSVCDEPRR